jgi:hypothetical protein
MSGAASLSQTEDAAQTVLRGFLLSIWGQDFAVVRGQDNRVAEPLGEFAVIAAMGRERLATNVVRYADGWPEAPGQRMDRVSTELVFTIEIHGESSGDRAQILTSLFRSEVACDFFARSGIDAAPLFCDEPKQMPFTSGEQQVEQRWAVDAHMQVNPVVTVEQDFAGTLDAGLINVDAAYPPAP